MHVAQTFDVALEGRTAGNREAQVVAEALQRGFRSLRNCLRHLPSSEVGYTAATLSGYYARAYERTNASIPVTSLRVGIR